MKKTVYKYPEEKNRYITNIGRKMKIMLDSLPDII